MARKTITVCDQCGSEMEAGKGAQVRVRFHDARRGERAGDLCDACAGHVAGHPVARRGRKPKEVAA